MKKTVTIAEKEIDLLKWGVRVLVTVLGFFAVQLYMQVQKNGERLDRLKTRIVVLETKAGIEKPKREE